MPSLWAAAHVLIERLDAYSVATWNSVWLGELDEAVRISTEGLAIAQPGQAPQWALHLYAWRGYALFLTGDWAEAIRAGDRMVQLWVEGARIAAGYAVRGFVAAFQAAQARRDLAAAERLRAPIEAIGSAFDQESYPRRALAFLASEPDLAGTLAWALSREGAAPPDFLERALSLACDVAQPPDPAAVERALARRPGPALAHVAAQAERAAGLYHRDLARLERARAAFERMGARPFVARARCEGALLGGDGAELAAGLAQLERIGDAVQVARYEAQARVRAS